ncbi:PKD domain-containing protein [Arthrobacter sp. LAPM80]|uniref:PKD domain-containing protein n=1 Tax=Arthrobacter sp. LAPM80 TaxID=3141788 RepID=UPI00398AAE07
MTREKRVSSTSVGCLPRIFWRGIVALLIAVATVAAVTVMVPAAMADSAPPDPSNPASPPTVTADGLPTVQIDGVVWQQVVVGNTVYVAGNFQTARPAGAAPGTNTVPRQNILAYDIRTGNLIAGFAANLNAQARTIAASPDGSRIYVGGAFTQVNGVNAYRIAALNPTTGALITSFAPAVNAMVKSIVATNTTVYAGGWFSGVGSVARANLAAFNASDGSLLPWNPISAGGTVEAMVISPDQSKMVIGGSFTTLNGSSNPGYGMGAVNTTTGALLPFAANTLVRDGGTAAAILSLASNGTQVYGTGYVFGAGGNLEGTFSANWTDGVIKWVEDCHGDTYSVYPGASAVYIAGHPHFCGTIGGFPQTDPPANWTFHRGLAFSTAATGTITTNPYSGYYNFAGNPSPSLLNWFPDMDEGTFTGESQGPWTVQGNSQYVVYGGEFLHVNGVAQQGLVRYAVPSIAPNLQGPMITGSLMNPTLKSLSTGTVRISWTQNWDRDNVSLKYDVIRDGDVNHPVYSSTSSSTFWTMAGMTFMDTGLAPGSVHGYRIFVTDPFGNEARSDTVNVTVAATGTLSNYALGVLADGASNYWRLGEASGSTAADLVGGTNIKLAAGVTRGVAGAITGDTDKATSFNGTSTGTGASSTAIPGPNLFTMEAWVKTTTTKGGKILGFGSNATGSSSSYDRHLYMDNAGHILFGVYTGTTQTVATTGKFNDGAWHQVAASLGPNGMVLYVDGVQVGQNATVTSGQAYNGYWRIGGDSLGGWPAAPSSNYINATIDEAAIYPSVLTPTTVANHFTLGKAGTVNKPPVAAFTATPTNLVVALNGTASTDPDGTVAAYSWNFGDGTPDGSGATTSHTYAKAGAYQVTLTVTDNGGATNAVTKTVTVTAAPPVNKPPVAAFTATPTNLVVALDGTASTDPDGTVAAYSWIFGDGTPNGSGATTSHTYAKAGTYQVTLTVTDNGGATNSISKTVTATDAPPANKPPVAAFTATAANLVVALNGTASTDPDGTVAAYSWIFGDGTPNGSGATTSHTYAKAGAYQVTLTVTDNGGATNALTKTVTVTAPPANVIASDAFARTVTNGWGTADVGGAWTVDSGNLSSYSVGNGSANVVNLPGRQPDSLLNAVSSTATDTTVSYSLNNLPGGGGMYVSVVGRQVDDANNYQAKIAMYPSGAMSVTLSKYVAGTETILTGANLTGLTYVAGAKVNVRLLVSGTNPTTVSAKVWLDGTPQPAAWTVTATDSSAALQAPGGVGMVTYLSGSAAANTTVSYSNFSVVTPQ